MKVWELEVAWACVVVALGCTKAPPSAPPKPAAPVAVASPVELARDQGRVLQLVADDAHAVWTTCNATGDACAVRTVGAAGPIGTIVTGAAPEMPSLGAVAGAFLYTCARVGSFVKDGGVHRIPLAGGPRVQLDPVDCVGLAVDGDRLVWRTPGDLRSRGLDAGPTRVLAERPGLEALAIAPEGAGYYVGVGGAVLRVPRDGGAPTPIVEGIAADDIAVDATALFFLERYGGEGCNSSYCGKWALASVPRAGGSKTRVLAEQAYLHDLHVRGGDVLLHGGGVFDAPLVVLRLRAGAAAPETLVEACNATALAPRRVVWSESAGTIRARAL